MSMRHRFAAYRELLQRYRKVFSHFWGERNNLGGGIFNQEEAEFLPAALALQEKPVSTTARWTGRLLMLFIVVALLWSIVGKMDIIVNARGKVIPSSHTKTIASVEVAAVRALYVNEGQAVKAGDTLIELDTTTPQAEHDKASGDAALARLQIARSQALIDAVENLRPPVLGRVEGVSDAQIQAAQRQLDGQYQDFRAKLARTEGDIARFSEALPLATQRAEDYKSLLANHDVAQHAWLEKEQARMDIEAQLADAKKQRTMILTQTRKDAHDVLTDGTRIAEDSQQDAKRAGEHAKLLTLTAPVDGTVQQLTAHTVGGVVPAAQPLMLIVPKDQQVEVEAMMENKDIGFVQEGQAAEVKVDAFEYTKYGTIPAHVTHVSRDAIDDEKKGLIYSVKITLDKSSIFVDGKNVPLTAGMSVDVEIKTGERRIIQYILSPLIQHQRESLHER